MLCTTEREVNCSYQWLSFLPRSDALFLNWARANVIILGMMHIVLAPQQVDREIVQF